ncbi:hypothetical protein N7457_001368 [Penicillium paradoxum]|uniref:uncharacterized protein n=1 Tax=Penicillium paradoxum TaxID=176176 RepID=UPI002547D257|nr:uncharacterized protein N7457_001368 [Penicillium paradoxum]KAJ5794769.1 hypothetical protein N7457_001368 [Penicillium paradoxum]
MAKALPIGLKGYDQKMEGAPNNSIQWETYREGVRSQLANFESLPHDGFALTRSYQVVLDNNETLTQYCSDEPLESYTLEARLRETLGIRPSSSSDSESPRSQTHPSVSWVNIFRHGKFEKQENGSYHCYDQGKLVQIDEALHKNILVNRCFLPANSYMWPSHADVERESEVTLAVEADVIEELNKQIKYVERLKRLQLSLRRRRIKLEAIRDPAKRSQTLQIPGLGIPQPKFSIKTDDIRPRSTSASSGVSSGSDIPFAGPRDDSNPTSLGSGGDAVKQSSQQEPSNSATQSNQTVYDQGKGVPVPAHVGNKTFEFIHVHGDDSRQSTPIISTNQTRDNTPNSQRTQGDGSGKHQMLDPRGLMEPPPKKQKTDTARSSADIATIELGEELAMWKEKLDTPNKPPPPSSNAGKGGKGKKRIRKNFTEYEREHAPGWFKSQVAAGKSSVEVEKAYVETFGVFHRYLTIKLWVDRMDEKASQEPNMSKIVVLKSSQEPSTTQAPSAAAPPPPSPSLATPPPYVSPYGTDNRSPSVPATLNWPSQTSATTPRKSGLPNID